MRAKFSENGAYAPESSSGHKGINRLRIGRANHNVDNEPEEYAFNPEEVTQEYLRRHLVRKGHRLEGGTPLAKIGPSP